MTTETRSMVDVADISGIEVECRECNAKVFYPREKNQERINQRCPNCNADLFVINVNDPRQEGSVSMEQVRMLMRLIKFLAKPAADLHANVRLQVNQTKP